VTTLCDRLNGFTRAVLPAGDKPSGTLRDEAVKILPMHSARGLQFRIVLLLWSVAARRSGRSITRLVVCDLTRTLSGLGR
jgi:ATP-dependent exoDNAse (exonuclease V) beta subunit